MMSEDAGNEPGFSPGLASCRVVSCRVASFIEPRLSTREEYQKTKIPKDERGQGVLCLW